MITTDIRTYVIHPTLNEIGLWSTNREILIYGTGMIETKYDYLMQMRAPVNGGIGLFQCQPSDFTDIHDWIHRDFNSNLLDKIRWSCGYTDIPNDPLRLDSDNKLAVIFCAVHYMRYKDKIPDENDAIGMSDYHWKYYNGGGLGKTNKANNVQVFRNIIDGKI